MSDTITIPVHASKSSETIQRTLSIDVFSTSFIKAFNNGHVWGVFYTRTGTIAYQDNAGIVHYNILKD